MPTEKRERGRPRKTPKVTTWPFSCPDLGRYAGEKLNEMSSRRRISKSELIRRAIVFYYDSEENQDELATIPPNRRVRPGGSF